MPSSVIEAIQLGIWDFEPEESTKSEFDSTHALPGSTEKLDVLADRLKQGKPLWHPHDRRSFLDQDSD